MAKGSNILIGSLTAGFDSAEGLSVGAEYKDEASGKDYVLGVVATGITTAAGMSMFYVSTALETVTSAVTLYNYFAGVANGVATEGQYIWLQKKGLVAKITHASGSIGTNGRMTVTGTTGEMGIAAASAATTRRVVGFWVSSTAATYGSGVLV